MRAVIEAHSSIRHFCVARIERYAENIRYFRNVTTFIVGNHTDR